MQISVLQPEITRGSIKNNIKVIQKLINQSRGRLIVLSEYALTGSLVLDTNVNVKRWVKVSEAAKSSIKIPEGKLLLINSLVEKDNKVYNACELLPTAEMQGKLFPDTPELAAGISNGQQQKVFKIDGKKFKVIICTDLRYIDEIPTNNLDFIFFIFHFSNYNFDKALRDARNVSQEREIPIIISSLLSDKNIGFSSYIHKNTVVSLPEYEGILEIQID